MSDDTESHPAVLVHRVTALEQKIRGIPASVEDHGRRIALMEQTVTRFGDDMGQMRSDLRDNFDLTRASLELGRDTNTKLDTGTKLISGLLAVIGVGIAVAQFVG